MDYTHELRLAPTQEMLDNYKKRGSSWQEYERWFIDLMIERKIKAIIPPSLLDNAVLLCSEAAPHNCHRRLVSEYLAEHWGDVVVTHL